MPPDPALPAPCGVDLEVMMAAAETDDLFVGWVPERVCLYRPAL